MIESLVMICGIDEAGRGPLAGPVTAAAVILGPDLPHGVLRDSKQLTAAQRERAAALIKSHATAWAVAWATVEEIDRLNILRAALLAMRRAYDGVGRRADEVLVDGNHLPDFPAGTAARAVVRGDETVPEIMAASILAKTARDQWMTDYDRADPRYGFALHKGYPTSEHRRRIAAYGPCPIHRRSFRLLPTRP